MIKCALQKKIYNSKATKLKSNVVFWRDGITEVSQRKPLGAEEIANQLSPLTTPNLGIKSRTHW